MRERSERSERREKALRSTSCNPWRWLRKIHSNTANNLHFLSCREQHTRGLCSAQPCEMNKRQMGKCVLSSVCLSVDQSQQRGFSDTHPPTRTPTRTHTRTHIVCRSDNPEKRAKVKAATSTASKAAVKQKIKQQQQRKQQGKKQQAKGTGAKPAAPSTAKGNAKKQSKNKRKNKKKNKPQKKQPSQTKQPAEKQGWQKVCGVLRFFPRAVFFAIPPVLIFFSLSVASTCSSDRNFSCLPTHFF